MAYNTGHSFAPMQSGAPGQTTEQVARRFGVSIPTVLRWRTQGSIEGHRVGREIRYADAEVERFARVRYGSLIAS